jgi:hypothetical protein
MTFYPTPSDMFEARARKSKKCGNSKFEKQNKEKAKKFEGKTWEDLKRKSSTKKPAIDKKPAITEKSNESKKTTAVKKPTKKN